MRIVLASFLALASVSASAQSLPLFGGAKRIGRIVTSVGTAGTSAAAVSATPISLLAAWQVCHHAASAVSYIAISEAVDPDAIGVRLAPGQCYACSNCGPATLSKSRVKASAPALYSVTQLGE